MRLKDSLYRAPAWVLLVLPVLLALLLFAFVLSFLHFGVVGRYVVFIALFLAILVSRMLRVWEWGVEVFHFLTFCLTFVYGFLFGATFTIVLSLALLYTLSAPRAHYLTYGTVSILIQSFGIFVNVLLAGALSVIAHAAVLSNLPFFGTAIVFIALLFDKFLTNRFVGIDWGRLSVSLLVGFVLNYNLFMLSGADIIGFLSQL